MNEAPMSTDEQWLAFVDDCAGKLLNGGLDRDMLARGAVKFNHYARNKNFGATLLVRCQNIDQQKTQRPQTKADIETTEEIFRNAFPKRKTT